MGRRLRVVKLSDSVYKAELVASSGVYAEAIGGAIRRAVALSDMTPIAFLGEILRTLDITPEDALRVVAHGGHTLNSATAALMAGEVIPCADTLLAAATIAQTTVGILLDESSLAEEVRGLVVQVRQLQTSPLTPRVTTGS